VARFANQEIGVPGYNKFEGKVKDARLKSRRPLQIQEQLQIRQPLQRAGGTPAYRQAGPRYEVNFNGCPETSEQLQGP
jgi:hypothetical protein